MTSRLDAIRQREQAATPGPWKSGREQDALQAVVDFGWPRVVRFGGDNAAEDEAFAAHARSDLPMLLAVVEAVRGLGPLQCADLCRSWSNDEACGCGMQALKDALAPLLEPEP